MRQLFEVAQRRPWKPSYKSEVMSLKTLRPSKADRSDERQTLVINDEFFGVDQSPQQIADSVELVFIRLDVSQ
jgi:hypothetical protein